MTDYISSCRYLDPAERDKWVSRGLDPDWLDQEYQDRCLGYARAAGPELLARQLSWRKAQAAKWAKYRKAHPESKEEVG